MEKSIVFYHGLGIEDRIERSFNLVFECKAVPSDFTGTILEHTRIETTEDIWRVVLRV